MDDEHTGLQVRALVLSGAGYRVLTATSCESALKMYSLNPVDVVIIEQSLVQAPGIDVIEEMRRVRPGVPIVVLGAMPDWQPDLERADLVITKGITPAEFLSKISALVRRHCSVPSA